MISNKIVFFLSVIYFYSCNNTDKFIAQEKNDTVSEKSTDLNPNVLFEKNCAMCHGYSKYMTAPAIITYSLDSIMNYYDGKYKKDSIWQEHKTIELTREEWKKIALQFQPGCY